MGGTARGKDMNSGRKTGSGHKEDHVTDRGQMTSVEIRPAQTRQKRRKRSTIWMNKMEAQEKVQR